MAIPSGIPIVDTLISFPPDDMEAQYAGIRRHTKDRESKESFVMPAAYMFKDVPDDRLVGSSDSVAVTLNEMDRWGIDLGLIAVGKGPGGAEGERALAQHPDRFIASVAGNPNKGMRGIEDIVRAHETFDVRAVALFPAGSTPAVPINDKKMYPIYAKCVELDLAVFCNAGVPGPRVPFASQEVGLIDEVMYDFPDLVFVTRHGCEPWTDLMVKLMLKWPNLHYSTSAFAPKYYPPAIIDYANTRGADRIIYAGYFPMGLSLERIMTEMQNVPLKEDVWVKFLSDNARRVLRIP